MAQCMFPYYTEKKVYHAQEDRYVAVPCGKCPECLKRRTASWSHRLETEALRWQKQFFVTLTYAPEHLPISGNNFPTLRREDYVKFFKRLRKRIGKCRYYCVGEYGTENKRPHYHLILFAQDCATEDDIISEWPFGHCYFGSVEAGSIRYTVQYYDKGDWRPSHKRDDRVPEFSAMSKGIGSNFMTPAMVQHLLDNPDKGFIYDHEGRKIAIPRYYKRKMYDYHLNATLIANHPSLLIHADDMLEKKKAHAQAMQELLDGIEVPEDTSVLQEGRKWAIENYRQSKRKTRTKV